MAVNDFEAKLQSSGFHMEGDSERQIALAIVSLLDDKSPDVQGRAVSCLQPLVRKISQDSLKRIVGTLLQLCTEQKEQEKRDIACVGLKNVIKSVSDEDGPFLVSQCAVPLLNVLDPSSSSSADIQSDLLDVLAELLRRFGPLMIKELPEVQKAVLPQLRATTRSISRKRAVLCLAHLSAVADDDQFAELVKQLTHDASAAADVQDKRTLVQAIGGVAKATGHRIGPFLADLIPVFLGAILLGEQDGGQESDSSDDQLVELKENCFQALETMCTRCPKEVAPFVDQLVEHALRYLVFDPNYAGNSDDDADMEDAFEDAFGDAGDPDFDNVPMGDAPGEDDGWGEAFGSDDEGFDVADIEDDDMSWKVRKSCAHLLGSVVQAYPDRLQHWYEVLATPLVKRFAEREDNVRMDVFTAFSVLLRTTQCDLQRHAGDVHALPYADALISLTSASVQSLHTQLKRTAGSVKRGASLKTRLGAFAVLKELCSVRENALTAENLQVVVPVVVEGLRETNTPLQLLVIRFARLLLESHPPSHFFEHFAALCEPVCLIVSDPHAKQVAADSLRLLTVLSHVLRAAAQSQEGCVPAHADALAKLYAAALLKLKASDVDQEVKECGIAAMCALLAEHGDQLKSELKVVLKLLLAKLQNEVSRLAAVRGLSQLASSPLQLALSPALPTALPLLASFLRKAHRPLKQSSLLALNALVTNYGTQKATQRAHAEIIVEAAALVSDSDLHLCELALRLVIACLRSCDAETTAKLESYVVQLYPRALSLVRSVLLQGQALDRLVELFEVLTAARLDSLGEVRLLHDLLELVGAVHAGDAGDGSSLAAAVDAGSGGGSAASTSSKQMLHTVACCAAAVIVSGSEQHRERVTGVLVQQVLGTSSSKSKSSKSGRSSSKSGRSSKSKQKGEASSWSSLGDPATVVQALLCLGEIGRRSNVGGDAQVVRALLSSFEVGQPEEVKVAGYQALGAAAVGAPELFIPKIMDTLAEQPANRYLLLNSLNELIRALHTQPDVLVPHLDVLLETLFAQSAASSDDEGTRNVTAECLGRLATAHPERLVPQIVAHLDTAPVEMVSTLKYMILEKPHPIDAVLGEHMSAFMSLLKDAEDIHLRRAALLAFSFAAHHKPALVWPLLDETLPLVYKNTIMDETLVKTVSFGPFQHKVDSGLDLRKAAFQCLDNLLEKSILHLDVSEFISHLIIGLGDVYDIRILAHLILIRLAQNPVSRPDLLANLDQILEPLRSTIQAQLKQSAVQQDVNRNEELVRSALRALACISIALEGAKKFVDFDMHVIQSDMSLASKYNTVKAELLGATSSSMEDSSYM